MMSIRLPLAIVAVAALATPAGALAQTYPAKTIRLVLPFTAASAVDVLARLGKVIRDAGIKSE